MGLVFVSHALWPTVETSQDEIQELFPLQSFFGLPAYSDSRDPHVAAQLVDQPQRLLSSYPEVGHLLDSAKISYRFCMYRSAAAIILNITYGYTLAEKDDPFVALADAAMRTLSKAGVFGTYLVDYLPVLKYVPLWMPGASFKRDAREWRCLSREMLDSPFMTVKHNMVRGDTIYA